MGMGKFAGTLCAYPGRVCHAELIGVAGVTVRWFAQPKIVTHSSTKRARRRVTLLIETTALTLSKNAQIANKNQQAEWPEANYLTKG